jgi:hypothetical protein
VPEWRSRGEEINGFLQAAERRGWEDESLTTQPERESE